MPTTYKPETYKEVLCWTEDTKIQYRPNPKRGKSFLRYAKYEKAKTPAQAMEGGSLAQDLFFDYEHGHIKVLGGVRRKAPLNPDDETKAWTKTDKMLARMHRAWQTWTKTFTVAKQLGVDRRQLTADKAGGETSEMRAGRLAANELAKMILKEAAKCKRKINDRDVVAVLRLWGFRENTSRSNVMKEGVKVVHSDTLGLVASYDGAVLVTAATTEYPEFTQVLCRRLSDHMPKEFSKHRFGWSSINVNANYAGALHRDANNDGPSFIKAFGDFSGGQLNYWGDDNKAEGAVENLCKPEDCVTMDIAKSLLLFDGNRGHSVCNFKGERFSLVYFCTGLYHKANKTVRDELERCGIRFPTEAGKALAKTMLGKPRGYKALSKSKALAKSTQPTALTWPQQVAPKQGTDFLSKALQQKARAAVKELGLGAATVAECTDTKFVSFRTAFVTLPDNRREAIIYLKGISGGERKAVVGKEDKVGSGHYSYKKADGFTLGPALDTQRMCDVREWCLKLGPKMGGLKLGKSAKKCLRSYENKKGAEISAKKRSLLASSKHPAKRPRVGGA